MRPKYKWLDKNSKWVSKSKGDKQCQSLIVCLLVFIKKQVFLAMFLVSVLLYSQKTFVFSKSTVKTLEKGVKLVQT